MVRLGDTLDRAEAEAYAVRGMHTWGPGVRSMLYPHGIPHVRRQGKMRTAERKAMCDRFHRDPGKVRRVELVHQPPGGGAERASAGDADGAGAGPQRGRRGAAGAPAAPAGGAGWNSSTNPQAAVTSASRSST